MQRFLRLILQMSDEPIQYIRGFVEFYKLKFKVDPRVLIPRPETELIVDEVIKQKPFTLLDIGTGAGNIAISCAKNLPGLKVVATDISKEALEVAQINAKLNGVESQIDWLESDLLGNILPGSHFDFIATNLPYIPTDRIRVLDNSVKDFEPHVALDGGSSGFELYVKLFEQLTEKKITFGSLMGEIDYSHFEEATDMMYKFFPERKCEVRLDLTARQRFVVIN